MDLKRRYEVAYESPSDLVNLLNYLPRWHRTPPRAEWWRDLRDALVNEEVLTLPLTEEQIKQLDNVRQYVWRHSNLPDEDIKLWKNKLFPALKAIGKYYYRFGKVPSQDLINEIWELTSND